MLVLLTAVLTMAANLMLRAGIDAAGGFAFGGLTGTVHGLRGLFMQPLFFARLRHVLPGQRRMVQSRRGRTAQPRIPDPRQPHVHVVTGGAVLWFGETLSPRVLGLAVILSGIFIISSTEGRA
jgi:hypothetical protein